MRVRIALFLAFILYSGLRLTAQTEGLISFDDLEFQNSFEEKVFSDVQQESFDPFELLMCMPGVDSANTQSWKKQYAFKVDQLKEIKKHKKNSKYVKEVYEFVHDQFLRKYEILSYFDELFQSGVYNCVTAVGLYGLVFDEVDIPYAIKETPTHVYIVAFPDSDQIGIETTDPVGGYKTFSPGFKQSFVNELLNAKLIDMSEMADGVNAVFDQYYFTNTRLGLKELAGLQYYNKAITHLNEQQYKEAYSTLKKAYYLHPTEHIEDLLINSAILTTSKSTYETLSDVDLLIFIANLGHGDVGQTEVLGEFGRLLSKQLIEKNDTTFLSQSHQKLVAELNDTSTIKEISFYYNYERARRAYNTGNYGEALPFSRLALALQPNNAEAQTLLVGTFNNALVAKVWEQKQYAQIIDSLYAQFPQLSENAHLGTLRAEIYLEAMYNAYTNGNPNLADKYQRLFEDFADANDIALNEWSVARSYSRGITHYFKKGWYKSARKILNAGLKYAPDNRELAMRKYYLDQAQY